MDIFSKGQLPDEVRESLQRSTSAGKLRNLSVRIQSLSKKLAIWIVIIGLISAVIDGANTELLAEANVAGIIIFLLLSAIPWFLGAVIEYFICEVIATVLEGASEMVQNTYDTRNMAVLTAAKECPVKVEKPIPSAPKPDAEVDLRPKPWVCPKCGGWNSSKDEVCFKCKHPRG
ncbi:MAG: hypothetical protein IJO09_03665 [Oscillospiraceae bacterium]|nr:hypothetical protein [Oscillospiraceae bacterium]